MKTKTKLIFDLFEEAVMIPLLCMILIITALGYTQVSNKKSSYLDGEFTRLYCRNDGVYGTNVYASGEASSKEDISKLRLRFLKDGQAINNFYLSNPVSFSDKELGSYTRNSVYSMQAYDSLSGKFFLLDEISVDCSHKVDPTFSIEKSGIRISKDQVKADGKDFAILEITVFDNNNEPLVGEPVEIILTDKLTTGGSDTKEVTGHFTDHHGKVKLKVVYDLSGPATDQVEITFAIGDKIFDYPVYIDYIHSSDNVFGEIVEANCTYNQDLQQLIDIYGLAYDPDDFSTPVTINMYLSDYLEPQKQFLISTNTQSDGYFKATINKEIFEYGDSIDIFALDLQSEEENYIGQINPNCQID